VASRKTGNFQIPILNRHSSPLAERGILAVLVNAPLYLNLRLSSVVFGLFSKIRGF
jgi:hypothetical protein